MPATSLEAAPVYLATAGPVEEASGTLTELAAGEPVPTAAATELGAAGAPVAWHVLG